MSTMLYKPGSELQWEGKSYDTVIVEGDVTEHINSGWFANPLDCWAEPAAPDEAAPTRSELEEKATELGVRFDGRTTDAKLSKLIAEKV
jgi:hypothetical protein